MKLPPSIASNPVSPEPALAAAESAYRLGRMSEASSLAAQLTSGDTVTRVRSMLTHGMALFELGEVVEAQNVLETAVEASEPFGNQLACTAMLAYFSRLAQFSCPDDCLPALSRLRQLVFSVADASSLGGLHLIVARLEASRGYCAKARRHLDIARQLIGRDESPVLRASADLVDSSLEMYSGNLERAGASAQRGFKQSQGLQMNALLAGCASNLGFLALCDGQPEKATQFLNTALTLGAELSFVRLSALDNLALTSLYRNETSVASQYIAECADTIAAQRLPARSWYDLAHQLTRCAHLERLGEWERIVELADESDQEIARRQFRAIRTALLCAKARALARMGRHPDADGALALAIRISPRGAVDPLIVLEASKGLCLSLRGEPAAGRVHFERALAGCRAIGHKLHEHWIERDRRSCAASRAGDSAAGHSDLSIADTAVLLGDACAALDAGHAVDVLAQRLAAILRSTAIAPRVDVKSESGHEYQTECSVSWTTGADGAFAIRLRGSDRLLSLRVREVRTLEEISLMKGLVEIAQAAVTRSADADYGGDDQDLWPGALPAGPNGVVFRSPRMLELLRIAVRLAAADLPVLLTGETGTGKEVFAQLIHDNSKAAKGPFVAFNSSAMAKDLVESQLFGHRRGAFTGAADSFPGVIRAAEHGTLFLDEIADVDLGIQPKFLRFLESGEVQGIGDLKPQRVHVRVVAATNADLDTLVAQGRFRSDLFYRLNVARIALPPLRERKDEIPALASLFLDRFSRECRRANLRLGDDAVAALLLYDWPGNIRQLANELRRVVAMAVDGQTIRSTDLARELLEAWNQRPTTAAVPAADTIAVRADQTLDRAIDELEQKFIERAMDASGGRVTEAAQLLGLSRKGLFLKRRRRGLALES